MNKIVAIFVSLLCMGNADAMPATVDYIIDGDTFSAYAGPEPDIAISVRVRLMNVDTPEIHGQCDEEITRAFHAKERLAELIPVGTKVELYAIKDDKYLGRIDAYVKTANGKDVGEILIREKLGRAYSGSRRESWCD